MIVVQVHNDKLPKLHPELTLDDLLHFLPCVHMHSMGKVISRVRCCCHQKNASCYSPRGPQYWIQCLPEVHLCCVAAQS